MSKKIEQCEGCWKKLRSVEDVGKNGAVWRMFEEMEECGGCWKKWRSVEYVGRVGGLWKIRTVFEGGCSG